MWGQNGKTFKRFDIDQGATVASWSTNQVRVPFLALKQAGFLRRLFLQVPRTAYALTVTTANYLSTTNTEQDFPALRSIASFSLTLQRVAPLYSMNRGIDFAIMEFMGMGRSNRTRASWLGTASFLTQTNKTSFGKTSAAWDFINGIVSQSAGSGTSQTANFGLIAAAPLTEVIKFPAGVTLDANGNQVMVPETMGEVGLVTLQNSQQNVVPAITLNPAWSLSGTTANQVWTGNTTLPSTPIAPVFNLWSEFYDVPEDPADWPPGYAFDYIIQYASFDDPISNGKVTHKFDNAGLLMRAAYVFLNANDNVVDASSLTTDGNIAFKWGSSVQHRNSNFQTNAAALSELYDEPALFGMLGHDFFQEDQGITEMVNTAVITSPRCEITGAPGTATTLHTIEQRLIPVAVRRQ